MPIPGIRENRFLWRGRFCILIVTGKILQITYKELKTMNGELVSGVRENLRVLVDYKGSGFPGGQMQDDLLLFSLRPDASPNPLALAVVNFPPIRGKRSLYIHRLSGEAPEDRDVLLDAIEAFARRQGYPVLYLNVMEQEMAYLYSHGFTVSPDCPIAAREVRV